MKSNSDTWGGRLARRLVRWLVGGFYPALGDFSGAERVPQSGPVLICANHANSLVDPVLVGIAARRPVRFLAKAPLFEVPLLGVLMRALGMLPAYRGSDDARQVRRNLESLDIASQALIDGQAMGIFPEGKSHDAAHVETVRSGAARVAVGAVEGGAKGVQVVPWASTTSTRNASAAACGSTVGEPIDVDRWLAEHGGESRPAMRALTTELEARLKAVAVHLDEPQWEPFLNDLEVLAPAAGATRGKAAPAAAAEVRRRRHEPLCGRPIVRGQSRGRRASPPIEMPRSRKDSALMRRSSARKAGRPGGRSSGNGCGSRCCSCRRWWGRCFISFRSRSCGPSRPASARRVARRFRSICCASACPSMPCGTPSAAGGCSHYFTTWFAVTCLMAMPFLGVLALAYLAQARDGRVARPGISFAFSSSAID